MPRKLRETLHRSPVYQQEKAPLYQVKKTPLFMLDYSREAIQRIHDLTPLGTLNFIKDSLRILNGTSEWADGNYSKVRNMLMEADLRKVNHCKDLLLLVYVHSISDLNREGVIGEQINNLLIAGLLFGDHLPIEVNTRERIIAAWSEVFTKQSTAKERITEGLNELIQNMPETKIMKAVRQDKAKGFKLAYETYGLSLRDIGEITSWSAPDVVFQLKKTKVNFRKRNPIIISNKSLFGTVQVSEGLKRLIDHYLSKEGIGRELLISDDSVGILLEEYNLKTYYESKDRIRYHQQTIQDAIRNILETPETVNESKLRANLATEYNILISKSTVDRNLNKMGILLEDRDVRLILEVMQYLEEGLITPEESIRRLAILESISNKSLITYRRIIRNRFDVISY